MRLPLFHVDAFAIRPLEGNPAAIVPLDHWLDDETLLNIARENNLSETAFFVPNETGFHLRWFSPTTEIPLCGHATLASAYVIFNELGYNKDLIHFETLSGELIVLKKDDDIIMDFPTKAPKPCTIPDGLEEALGVKIKETYQNHFVLCVTHREADVKNAKPDHKALSRIKPGEFILTAKSQTYDFVSRCFAPAHGLEEDPVTGAAHCVSAPYWADKLGKATLRARQVSKRGGDVTCVLKGNRVELMGRCALFMKGTITL
ncbi:MAG: PhzF family phenazine biosynthesis protein [Methylocystaceae bacterium]|nr:PhzF family phenazine biosynthesis protein [Methylocystaceae bacterium]